MRYDCSDDKMFVLAEEFAAVCARERLSARRVLSVQLDVVSQHAATMKRFLAQVALVASLLRVLRHVVYVELVLGAKARRADVAESLRTTLKHATRRD